MWKTFKGTISLDYYYIVFAMMLELEHIACMLQALGLFPSTTKYK